MIAPIRREPLEPMQDGVIGTYDFRTGKIKYPQPGPFGGEIKPGIRDHLHRFDDPIDIFADPYIPNDDNQGIELFGRGNRMAALGVGFPHTNVRNYDGKILPYFGGTRINPDSIRPKGTARFQALIPRDDELGDIIKQQDRDIFDEYRRLDGENLDPFAPSPIRKAGGFNFINDLMA